MKVSKFITITCVSLVLAGFSYQTSSYAEKSPIPFLTAQSSETKDSMSIKEKAEKMVDLFFSEKFEEFTGFVVPTLKPEVSPERLKNILTETTTENGKFVSIVESKVIDTIASDFVILTLKFEKVTEDWTFIFNDDKQVVGLNSPISKSVEIIAMEFMEDVNQGEYGKARALLNPFLKDSIFPENIKQSWERLTTRYGKLNDISIERISRSSYDNTQAVLLQLQFEKSNEQIFIIFDGSKSIIGVDWVE